MLRRITLLLTLALAVALPPLTSSSTATAVAERPGFFADFYPPSPDTIYVLQPNGKRFPATLTHAEIGGALEVDGYSVTKREDGWWVYASGRNADGLTGSPARVGVDQRPASLTPGEGRVTNVFEAPDGSDMRADIFRQLQAASAQAQAAADAAGTQRIFRFPVLLLATWWDADKGQTEPQFQAGNTAEKFQKLLSGFGGNPKGTLTEFYLENSFNKFKVIVDVYGPYTSQRSMEDRCYYGGNDVPEDPTDDFDPTDSVLGIGGLGAAGMAIEAVPQSDADVDYTQYDNDGDGYVDFMGLLHSGPDMAATGNPCHTWSHALPISTFGNLATGLAGVPDGTFDAGLPTSDGVLVDRVFTMPEVELEIGVATHEMAHALGEPDYYNTTYASMGTGEWDIMAGGSWLGNPAGSNPSGFNPASRVFQGWMGADGANVKVITGDVRGLKLRPRELFPDIAIVPVTTIGLGETDKYGHTWTANDLYGLVKLKTGKYVVEGYYLENWSRSATGKPLPGFKRSPYFDRMAWNSGLMSWHFDYYKRSNVYFGSNDAQTDPARPQMDPMEFDYNDNTQELQLNLVRGEATDLVFGAAAGITSGTRMVPPGTSLGTPQAGSTFEGTLPPAGSADHPFVVQNNPANEQLVVTAGGLGDCTLQVLIKNADGSFTALSKVADSGSAGDSEMVTVSDPKPGNYVARVGDFAACTQYTGAVKFESGSTGFVTTGAADTWSNWTRKPTGWAFTNVRPSNSEGLESGLDSSATGTITLDVLKLGATRRDLAPGFAFPAANGLSGRVPVIAKKSNAFSVPVFNNGGRPATASVQVRAGSPTGPKVASGLVKLGGYARKEFRFSYTPAREGSYRLFTIVDKARSVAEAVETNNVQRVTGWAGPVSPKVLVVDDDAFDAEQGYAGALASLGIPYAIATNHVSAATMAKFKAVIWETGQERGVGTLDESDQAQVKKYLVGGGKVLVTSPRAADALAGTELLTKYFGAEFVYVKSETKGFFQSQGFLGTAKRTIQPFENRPVLGYFKVSSAAAGKAIPLASLQLNGTKAGLLATAVDGPSWRTAFMSINLAQFTGPNDAESVLGPIMKFLGVSPGGYKAPTTATIYHRAVRYAVGGQAVTIKTVVLGNSTAPTLAYRVHGTTTYKVVKMVRGSKRGVWYAVIPASLIQPRGIDYVVRAGKVSHPISAPSLAHYIAVAPNNL